MRHESPYAKIFDSTFQEKVRAENAALIADAAATAVKEAADAALVEEVARQELAAGEHVEPPSPAPKAPDAVRAKQLQAGKEKAAAKARLLHAAPTLFAATAAVAMAAAAAGAQAEVGVFGDDNVTGKRQRVTAPKAATAGAPKQARLAAGVATGAVAAPVVLRSEGLVGGASDSDADGSGGDGDVGAAPEASSGSGETGAAAAALRGPAFESRVTVLADELLLGVFWRNYADAVTSAKRNASTKKTAFFDALDSIIDQYSELDGEEKRAAAFAAVKAELEVVTVPSVVNVDAVIRKHLALTASA